ncbi:nitric oxide reductase activation protein NorD [Halarcobacter sp.]|uniref:nitric oxide reductase activation protein NorD n=1 Tax=Halarcobacter sp. TaxID=2321133 RepID=UPI003B00D2C7
MEEYIGKVWDKYITKKARKNFEEQTVFFEDNKKALRIFYHLLGGDKTKELYITDKRSILKKRRTLSEKVSGVGKEFYLPWQDEEALYLPPSISYFKDEKSNQLLYFWLIAMMSNIDVNKKNIISSNIKTTKYLLSKYEGFEDFYHNCSNEIFEQYEELEFIKELDENSSKNILEIQPFYMWIYPALKMKKTIEKFEEDEPYRNKEQKDKTETLLMKKKVEKIDDKSKTDGLLVFLPEGLMSILERVNVDRSEDDSFDENALFNAQDLDEITIGRKKANLNARIKMDLDIENATIEEYPIKSNFSLDEWDYKKQKYLENFVNINPIFTKNIKAIKLPTRLKKITNQVQHELDLMQLDKIKRSNLDCGDEINLNTWIDYKSSKNKNLDKQNFFESFQKNTRDMSTLILADTSLSTEAGISSELRVIDMIKDGLIVFSEALERLQDNFSIYAFSSLKNKDVKFHLIKNFQEKYNDTIRGRIDYIKPGYYTRLGAAIRQSTKILETQKTKNRLLLIISDGKPNDVDKYDGRYGIEDTKKAINEVKAKGIVPFCITIDLEAKSYLTYLFGKNGFTVIRNVKKLPKILPEIYMNLTKD